MLLMDAIMRTEGWQCRRQFHGIRCQWNATKMISGISGVFGITLMCLLQVFEAETFSCLQLKKSAQLKFNRLSLSHMSCARGCWKNGWLRIYYINIIITILKCITLKSLWCEIYIKQVESSISKKNIYTQHSEIQNRFSQFVISMSLQSTALWLVSTLFHSLENLSSHKSRVNSFTERAAVCCVMIIIYSFITCAAVRPLLPWRSGYIHTYTHKSSHSAAAS